MNPVLTLLALALAGTMTYSLANRVRGRDLVSPRRYRSDAGRAAKVARKKGPLQSSELASGIQRIEGYTARLRARLAHALKRRGAKRAMLEAKIDPLRIAADLRRGQHSDAADRERVLRDLAETLEHPVPKAVAAPVLLLFAGMELFNTLRAMDGLGWSVSSSYAVALGLAALFITAAETVGSMIKRRSEQQVESTVRQPWAVRDLALMIVASVLTVVGVVSIVFLRVQDLESLALANGTEADVTGEVLAVLGFALAPIAGSLFLGYVTTSLIHREHHAAARARRRADRRRAAAAKKLAWAEGKLVAHDEVTARLTEEAEYDIVALRHFESSVLVAAALGEPVSMLGFPKEFGGLVPGMGEAPTQPSMGAVLEHDDQRPAPPFLVPVAKEV